MVEDQGYLNYLRQVFDLPPPPAEPLSRQPPAVL
jgi:hypothetical protein